MEFKQTKTQLIISDEELDILKRTLSMLNLLMGDMENETFNLITTDYFDIDYEFLNKITNGLYALINSNELEVE